MVKNNKKLFGTLIAYAVILLAVIGVFILFMNYRTANDTTTVYRAKSNISAGDTIVIDTGSGIGNLEAVELPTSSVEEIIDGGFDIAMIASNIGTQALVDISQGSLVSYDMFGTYTVQTLKEYYTTLYGYTEITEMYFEVDETTSPADGYYEGERLSIEVTYYDSSQGATYLGVIVNNCTVYKIYTDSEGYTTGIVVLVEKEDYDTLKALEYKNASFIFREGELPITATTAEDEIENAWVNSGLDNTYAKELSTYVEYTNSDSETIKETLFKYATSQVTTTVVPSPEHYDVNDIDDGITIYTPYSNITIVNYGFDGDYGSYIDLTGTNTSYDYNSRTGYYSFNFSEEGYYVIYFYDTFEEDVTTSDGTVTGTQEVTGLANVICFVIEADDNITYTSELGLTIALDSTYKYEDLEITGTAYKAYYETLNNSFDINLYEELTLSNDIFDTNNDSSFASMINWWSASSLGTVGNDNITNIGITYSDNSLSIITDLFRSYSYSTKYYEKITDDQLTVIKSLLGVDDTDVTLLSSIEEAMKSLSYEDANALIDELFLLQDSDAYYLEEDFTYSYISNGKVETTTVTYKSVMLDLLGKLWTGTLTYDDYESYISLGVENFKLVVSTDAGNSYDVAINIYFDA